MTNFPTRRMWTITACVGALCLFLGSFTGVAVAGLFSDISGSPFETQINRIAGAGIATGFPDGTYRPQDAVNRQQMAAFINRSGGRVATDTGTANDVGIGATVDVASVSITAGAESSGGGFVILIGEFQASTTSAGCPCNVNIKITNGANAVLANANHDLDATLDSNGFSAATLTDTHVIPIAGGTAATFKLRVSNFDNDNADIDVAGGRLTALYVPFAQDGGNALTP